jgi:Tol biopolymer transport system component
MLGGRNRVPVWSADSEHVAFQSNREDDLAVWWQRADGTTPAERLTKPDKDTAHVPESWSPDGKTLLFSVVKGSSYSLAALAVAEKKVTAFAGVESSVLLGAAFSPEGKWVAYTVGKPGDTALFVQPFPPTGATYPVSKGGGIHATWTPDGKELVYTAGPAQMVAVSVTTRPAFTFSNSVPVPRPFVERNSQFERNYDVMPARRFSASSPSSRTPRPPRLRLRRFTWS